eukprot:1145126-Pelagomonas_calceolata.AAC.1
MKETLKGCRIKPGEFPVLAHPRSNCPFRAAHAPYIHAAPALAHLRSKYPSLSCSSCPFHPRSSCPFVWAPMKAMRMPETRHRPAKTARETCGHGHGEELFARITVPETQQRGQQRRPKKPAGTNMVRGPLPGSMCLRQGTIQQRQPKKLAKRTFKVKELAGMDISREKNQSKK